LIRPFQDGIGLISRLNDLLAHCKRRECENGDRFLVVGVNSMALEHFAYDTESKQSAKTRVRVLDMLAAGRIPQLAHHFPWPGIKATASAITRPR
jgi:hypothetical protein